MYKEYYSYEDYQIKAYRKDNDETVYSFSTSNPIAVVSKGVWYDWHTKKVIAYEEQDAVYDSDTIQPIYYVESD